MPRLPRFREYVDGVLIEDRAPTRDEWLNAAVGRVYAHAFRELDVLQEAIRIKAGILTIVVQTNCRVPDAPLG